MTSVSEASAELTRARHAEGMAAYCREGLRIAREIGNRGPARFDAAGGCIPTSSTPTGSTGSTSSRASSASGRSPSCEPGRPRCWSGRRCSKGAGRRRARVGRRSALRRYTVKPYLFIKPLSDPRGGTDALDGRHPSKMAEPCPTPAPPTTSST